MCLPGSFGPKLTSAKLYILYVCVRLCVCIARTSRRRMNRMERTVCRVLFTSSSRGPSLANYTIFQGIKCYGRPQISEIVDCTDESHLPLHKPPSAAKRNALQFCSVIKHRTVKNLQLISLLRRSLLKRRPPLLS